MRNDSECGNSVYTSGGNSKTPTSTFVHGTALNGRICRDGRLVSAIYVQLLYVTVLSVHFASHWFGPALVWSKVASFVITSCEDKTVVCVYLFKAIMVK